MPGIVFFCYRLVFFVIRQLVTPISVTLTPQYTIECSLQILGFSHSSIIYNKKVKAVSLLVLLANTNWNVFVYFIAEVYSIIN